jgi:hypothetical protein
MSKPCWIGTTSSVMTADDIRQPKSIPLIERIFPYFPDGNNCGIRIFFCDGTVIRLQERYALVLIAELAKRGDNYVSQWLFNVLPLEPPSKWDEAPFAM